MGMPRESAFAPLSIRTGQTPCEISFRLPPDRQAKRHSFEPVGSNWVNRPPPSVTFFTFGAGLRFLRPMADTSVVAGMLVSRLGVTPNTRTNNLLPNHIILCHAMAQDFCEKPIKFRGFVTSWLSMSGGIGAGEGNRTLVFSLGSCCSAIELHPHDQIL